MSEFNGGITADIDRVHIAGHTERDGDIRVTRCQCHGDVLEKFDAKSERSSWLMRGRQAAYAGTAFMTVAEEPVAQGQFMSTAL